MLMTNEPTIYIEVSQEVMDLWSQEIPATMPAPEMDEAIIKGDPIAEEKIITDVWVGIVLTLLVMSCIACMCSCVVYHRFQIWKRNVLRMRPNDNITNVESANAEVESLPSYTIVSGLPSYDEALQQLKVVKQSMAQSGATEVQANSNTTTSTTPAISRLSVSELMQLYKQHQQTLESKDDNKTNS